MTVAVLPDAESDREHARDLAEWTGDLLPEDVEGVVELRELEVRLARKQAPTTASELTRWPSPRSDLAAKPWSHSFRRARA